MKTINKISDGINKAVELVTVILFVILIVACVMQVFFRFVLNNSLSWTEEVARFSFIWMHQLAASLLIESDGNATVTLFLDMIHGKARNIWNIIIQLVVFVDGSLMMIYGVQLAKNTFKNASPALHFPMGIVNAAVAAAGILLMIQAFVMILRNAAEFSQGGAPKKTEE